MMLVIVLWAAVLGNHPHSEKIINKLISTYLAKTVRVAHQVREANFLGTGAGTLTTPKRRPSVHKEGISDSRETAKTNEQVFQSPSPGMKIDSQEKLDNSEEENLVYRPVVTETREFVVYENQRYWVVAGFSNALLPGDWPGWSDESGGRQIDQSRIELPDPTRWQWVNNWEISKGFLTDPEGWEYAGSFNTKGKWNKANSLFDAVRRRKWVRTCDKIH